VWNYTPNPQYVFMASYFVKHENNFTFSVIEVEYCGSRYPVPLRCFSEVRVLLVSVSKKSYKKFRISSLNPSQTGLWDVTVEMSAQSLCTGHMH
jgi:hypothetical protein